MLRGTQSPVLNLPALETGSPRRVMVAGLQRAEEAGLLLGGRDPA